MQGTDVGPGLLRIRGGPTLSLGFERAQAAPELMPKFHVEQVEELCRKCGKRTVQTRSTPYGTWLFNMVLGICTLGLWLLLLALVRALTGSGARPWVCSVCYRSPPKTSNRPRMVIFLLFAGLLAACYLLLKFMPGR